jgi:hypothetical protein
MKYLVRRAEQSRDTQSPVAGRNIVMSVTDHVAVSSCSIVGGRRASLRMSARCFGPIVTDRSPPWRSCMAASPSSLMRVTRRPMVSALPCPTIRAASVEFVP